MQNTLIYFGGKPNADKSGVLSQLSLSAMPTKAVTHESDHSGMKKEFRMTNGWTSNRSIYQEFRFHRASGSVHDKPLATNKIGSSLLGGRLHASKDLLVKTNSKFLIHPAGHQHCISVQTVPYTDRPKLSSPRKDFKKSFLQEDRISDGLHDIFDRLTGQNFRSKMKTVPNEDSNKKGSTPPRVSARRIATNEDEE